MTSLWRVARYARRHRAWLGVAAAAILVVVLATVFAYNLVRPIYDELLTPSAVPRDGDPTAVGLVGALDRTAGLAREWVASLAPSSRSALLVLVVLAVSARALGSYVAHLSVSRIGLATIRDLRDDLFRSLLGQSPAWFAGHPTPTLVSRAVHDVQLVSEALAERLGDLVQDALTVAALLAYALSLDLRLALVTLVLAPLMVAPVVRLSRRLRRRSRETLERLGDLATVLDESVRGMRVIQAFAAEPQAAERFRGRTGRHLAAALRARAIQIANAPAMEVVGALGAAALIGYASRRIAAGSMTLGDLSAFLVAVYGCYNPVKRLNKLHLALQQAAAAAERVLEIVDARSGVADADDAVDLEGVGEGVRLEGVWFAYSGEEWVLRGIDLEIPRGRTVAVVGPSGAGKTTLAQLLPRFSDPQRGVVRVGGHDLRTVRLASLRRGLGLVTQETLLFDDSVAANIALGAAGASRAAVEDAARAAGAHDFIAALPEGYDTRLGEGGQRLSGGQRQRLAIARALLRDPGLLILDEATSSLDAETERRVQASLERLAAGRTTLVIAHRLSTVRNADEIVVLDRGLVVERGAHDRLIAAGGLYARLYRDQETSQGPVL